MLLIFSNLRISSAKHQLNHEGPTADHRWTSYSSIWVFKVRSLQCSTLWLTSQDIQNAATWLITLTGKHDHITSILLIIGFQWILHHFKILFITTRHSTTWHHCTYPICLHPTLHWVNYIDHLDIFLICGTTQKDMVQDPSLWQPHHRGKLCHMTLKIVLALSTFNKDLKKPLCCHFSTNSFSEFLQRFVGFVKCLWTLRY